MLFFQDGKYGDAFIAFLPQLAVLIVATFFLFKNFTDLNKKSYRAKYEPLYIDMTLKRKKAVYYFPVYFATIASMLIGLLVSNRNSAIEINILLNLNVFSFIAYGEMRSHNTRWRRNIEFFNMWAVMVLSYLKMSMTTFN
jgi:hypothetical protein